MTNFIMLCGLPASGKSTVAKRLSVTYNAKIHSSDTLRVELFGDINECSKNDELFQELHRRIKKDLADGHSVIYDATNTNYKRRAAFLKELKKYKCKNICYLVAAPYQECLQRNANRERQVPESVLKKMYTSIYIPQKYEGWDEIDIVFTGPLQTVPLDELIGVLDCFQQDNPYHTLTLGQHLRKCYDQIDASDPCLKIAALLHDIGKPVTKSFKNYKGEVSDVAHYYNHEHAGAYNAVLLLAALGLDTVHILTICNYIQWHMKPYFIKTEQGREKFIKLVGQEFYNKLMLLHAADIAAH